jgi:hypothetical protein
MRHNPRQRQVTSCGVWAPGALVLLVTLAAPRPAAGFTVETGPIPRHRLVYDCITGAQVNPLGIQTTLDTGYRYRLFASRKLLWRDTFVGANVRVGANPAYTRIGGAVELQPMAALMLRARYENRGYFGSANMLQSFATPYAEHSDEDNADGAAAGKAYAGSGHEFTLTALLRAKVGPVALLDELNMHYFHMSLRQGDRLFYDAFFDVLAPDRGWVLVNHLNLVYLTTWGWTFGLRYSVVHALYPDAWLDPARGGNPNTPNHKLGPLVGYTFKSKSPYFKQPTVIVSLNWWLRSRYRTGEHVHQAVPYGLAALLFKGDIWSR